MAIVPTNCHFSYGKASEVPVESCLFVLIGVAQARSCWQMAQSIGALAPFEGGHSGRTWANQLRNTAFRRINWSKWIQGSPLRKVGRGIFWVMAGCVGVLGKVRARLSRGLFENLLHGVAFCCIFLVIVKFTTSPGAPGTGQVGEAAWFSFVVFAPYRAILRHFLVVVRVGGLQPLMDSVAHAFLFVKLGKSMDGTAISRFFH